jgi:hypothetical protein
MISQKKAAEVTRAAKITAATDSGDQNTMVTKDSGRDAASKM